MEYTLSVVVFAFTASITPGPNTIMAMASGLNFGTQKSLPLLFGICTGFAAMLFVIGVGFGQIFEVFPMLNLYLKILGVGYLLYLASRIAKSGDMQSGSQRVKPLGFKNGVFFQWVNAKAWVVCVSAVSAFTTPGEFYLTQLFTLTFAFLLLGPPCVAVWVILGSYLKQQVGDSKIMRKVNVVLALLLALSVLPILYEVIV